MNEDVINFKERMAHVVENLEKFLEKSGIPMSDELKRNVQELRELFIEQRAPRMILIGRRGCGKSSLINALFAEQVAEVGHEKSKTGAAKWHTYHGRFGALDILDTRGLQEGSDPDLADDAASPLDSILHAIKPTPPDLILFVIKAKEIDAAISGDLDGLLAVVEFVQRTHGYKVPIFGVISQADELEPKDAPLHAPHEAEHPDDIADKLDRVHKVEDLLRRQLAAYSKLKDHVAGVIAVSSYMRFRRDGSLHKDERWQIDKLVQYLSAELPNQARIDLARLSQVQAVQIKIADRLTTIQASVTAGVALIPIPVADIGLITPIQTALIAGIAYIAGREMTLKTAGEFLAAIGGNMGIAFGLREVARQLVKLIPGLGSAISAGVAAAGTYGVGKASTAYFIRQESAERAKNIMHEQSKNYQDNKA
jgi:predicted GTPase